MLASRFLGVAELRTAFPKGSAVKLRLSGTLGEWGVPLERTVTYDTQF
jgi:hypothetical protein